MSNFTTLPKKEYILKRLEMTAGNLVLLCATGSSGKTLFAQYIATCIDSGNKLFGQFDVKQGEVKHIDAEMSLLQTHRRYIRLGNALGLNEINVERITFNHRLTPNDESELINLCKGIKLLIIDSLKSVVDCDENTGEIEKPLKMLKRIAEKANCIVLLIHHKGKGKDAKQSGRGHSSIYDSVDIQIDLECSNEIYELKCAKNREGKYFAGIKYTLNDTGIFSEDQNCTEALSFELLQGEVKNTKQTQKEKIVAALQGNQLMLKELFDQVKGDRGTFYEVLKVMLDNKEIKEDKGHKGARMFSLIKQDWK